MKMKRIIVLLLICTLAFGLTACETDETTNQLKNEDKRKVVVGTSASYIPWAFQENDEVIGIGIYSKED